MAALHAAPGSNSFFGKVRDTLVGFARVFASLRRWAPALATILAIVLIVDQFRNAPSVRAAALLQKASAAADSRAPKARTLQVRTRSQRLTRVIGQQAQTSRPVALVVAEQQLQQLFASAHYDWDDPLSARAFQSWRAQLPQKTDQISSIADPQSPDLNCFEIRTTTESGELLEARLKLRQSDLHPVETTLHFRNNERVEITELPEEPVLAPGSARTGGIDSRAMPPVRSGLEPAAGFPVTITSPATPADELRVFAVLHKLGADLGEPIEVERNTNQILVRGIGISPDLRRQMRQEMESLPHVELEFAEPETAATVRTEHHGTTGLIVSPDVAKWQSHLEKHLGGRPALHQFSEDVLDHSDQGMARVHALRHLAERFPAPVEAQMDNEDRARLRLLRTEHALALSEHLARLDRSLTPVLSVLTANSPAGRTGTTAPPALWQTAAAATFQSARQLETGLGLLLGGAPGNPSADLPVQLRTRLEELKTLSQFLLQP